MSIDTNRYPFNRKIKTDHLLCPVCESSKLVATDDGMFCGNSRCKQSKQAFLSVNGKPVLIDFNRSLVTSDTFMNNAGRSVVVRTESDLKKWVRRVFRGKSAITKKNVSELKRRIKSLPDPRILVVGGGEIGAGLDELYTSFHTNILSFDIYDSPNVDIIADGHQIPVQNNYFDVVIIQAVLEHVLNPHRVVAEITRVLKDSGIVYAETPFIQQVHEGPYDFTRFTESGHRYLFKNYTLLSSGTTSGAGSALIWTLDFFISGLFRTRKAGKIMRMLFFWLRFFDRLIPESFNTDAACGVFFMGTKSQASLTNNFIVEHYKGSQIPG